LLLLFLRWMLRGWTSSFVWHDLSDMDNAQHINIFGFISRQPIHLTVDRVPEGLDKSEASSNIQWSIVFCPLLRSLPGVVGLMRCWKDLGGFVQRQDVTFLKKTSPYIVVVDAKDNLTQQPNSFTITEAVLWKLTFGSDA
ncbi:hypothetical protein T4A_6909, partial [Trichinella pseudospiralis]